MAFIALEPLQAKTTTFTTSGATSITTDSTTVAYILAQLGASGNYTTVAVTDGIGYEFMHITGVSSGALTVDRAQGGTTAVNLASGATIRYVWLTEGIIATAPGGTVTCSGTGATSVTGGPAYTIHSDIVNVAVAGPGLGISGSFPSWTLTNTAPAGATGATGPAGPSTAVTASGIASASGGGSSYNVDVPTPNFTAGTGISVTGTYPNFTIANTQTQGGTGTVTSLVAGARIAITGGTPTINPTVGLTTVGPGAGTYGGITIDAYGCITAIASGIITSFSTSTAGVTIANPTSGVWTTNIGTASTGTQGLIRLAAATSGGSNNAGDATSAVTPAGVNAVVNSLNLNPAIITAVGSQVALGAGSYTNTVAALPIVVTVPSGKTAAINIYVEVYDPAATTVVQNFGIGLFNGGSLLAGVSNLVPSSVRNLQYLVTGPLTATLMVKTTALAGTQTLGSCYATIIANG